MQSYYRRQDGSLRSMMTPVNTVIIVLNIVIYLWMLTKGSFSDSAFMYDYGANYWPAVFLQREYYRLITCTFLHFGFTHLFNNMLVLAFIGDNLERAFGSVRYAIFYLLHGAGSSAISDLWSMYTGSRPLSAGASGAIFGVVGALVIVLIRHHGRLEDLNTRQLVLFAAFSVYHGISSAGTDNAAHIGGFILGALVTLLIYRPRRRSRSKR